ncbi:DUF4232 domain-containing protein [Agromyces neolithicus]|uniref:DUF4232 domain-containing protein n=1 Tax=Agromyces neolithicus TaxID=269420 RepID=A0ABN2MCQ4_9MICO
MRPTALLRFLLPGLVAVGAWFASDALSQFALSTTSPTISKALRLVAPATIQAPLSAPEPWGAWVAVASVLAVGAGYLFFSAVFRAGGGSAGFAAGWLAAVLAGVVAVGVPTGVQMAAAVLDRQLQAFPTPEVVDAAAFWGVVWGWLPALTATLLARAGASAVAAAPSADRPAPAGPGRRRVILVASSAVAAVLGLGALAIVTPLALDAQRAVDQAVIAESEPAAPEPVGVPIPEVAPGEWQIDPTWCTENQLAFTASTPDGAAGHRGMRITATNTSNAPCVVEGYPDLAFSDPVTNGFETSILHGDGMLTEPDAGPVRLDVAPGASVEADLSWNTLAHSDRDPAGFMHIAAYPGAVRQFVQVDTDITGGELEVTAWRAAAPAAAG